MMQNMDDTGFDFEVRSILDNVQEDVPEHVWDRISTRLDALDGERRKRRFLRLLRYSAVTAAAAAAIAVGVMMPLPDSHRQPASGNGMIAIAESGQGTHDITSAIAENRKPAGLEAGRPESGLRPDAVISPSEMMSSGTDSGRSDAEEGILVQETSGTEDRTENTAVTEEKQERAAKGGTIPRHDNGGRTKAGTESYSSINEDFLPEAQEGGRFSTAVVISGNAISNSKSKSVRSQMMMSPSKAIVGALEETGESAYAIPLSFGIGAKVSLTPRWSVSAGINYTMLSRTFKGYYYKDDGAGTAVPETPPTSITNTLSYIGIPVNVYFNIVSGDFVDFYAYCGGTAEKCIENKFVMKEMDLPVRRQKVAGMQYSANVGLGAEFILTDWLGLYIDPSLRYYFNCSQPKSIRTVQPLALGFEMGLRVRL